MHVGADQVRDRVVRHSQSVRRACAMIVAQLSADAQKPAVGIRRDIDVPNLIALKHGSQEVLEPILDPLERRPKQESGRGNGELFRMENSFGTESATNIRSDVADLVFRQCQHIHQHCFAAVWHLRAAPDREQIGGLIEAGDHAAPFDQSVRRPCAGGIARKKRAWRGRMRLRDRRISRRSGRRGCPGNRVRALGDPGCNAATTSTTAGKGPYFTATAAAASSARARLWATTSAIGSPT